MLRACLDSLRGLAAPGEVHVVVVENDAALTLQAQALFPDGFPWPLHFVCEPTVGIPYARNAAVRQALEVGADWIAFIDDDEKASSDWLNRLLLAAREFEANAVQGPLCYEYPDLLPGWFVVGRKRAKPTGTVLKAAATNNVLVSRKVFDAEGWNLAFDKRFRFTGGSDTALFQLLVKKGGKIVWCEDAVVTESVPVERLTLAWQAQRAFRVAENGSEIEISTEGAGRAVPRKIVKGGGRIIHGALLCLAALPYAALTLRLNSQMVRGILKVASGVGALAGLLGLRMNPYLRIDGH